MRDVAVNPAPAGLRDPHRQVTELEDFDDDPAKPNEAKLEAIQMAWYEEWKDARERVSPL
ncbi:MAG: Fe-S cluster assembly protein IscX [Acidobacteria bacterium]|nr:Fe-S cluster assembly protein IscX [Acidobacteriota bacterium]